MKSFKLIGFLLAILSAPALGALNTANERGAALGVGGPAGEMPLPNGSIDTRDRYQAAEEYNAINYGPELTLWYKFDSTHSLVAVGGYGPDMPFSRAGSANSASYFDAAGILQVVGSGVPRFDYDPATGESIGLLIEDDSENIQVWSEEFDQASWLKSETSVSADAVTAPDGATTADEIIESAADTTHYVRDTVSVDGSSRYIFYVFGKQNTRSEIRVEFVTAGFPDASYTDCDLAAGTSEIGAGADTGGIRDIGGGWYQCYMTATSDAVEAGNQNRIYILNSGSVSYEGDGASSVYLWGAQVEEGIATQSSYVPTAATSTDRFREQAELTDIDWYNAADGTWYSSAYRVFPTDETSNKFIFMMGDGSSSDYMGHSNNDENLRFIAQQGSSQEWALGGMPGSKWATPGESHSAASSYSTSTVFHYIDGEGGTGNDTGAVTLPAGIDRLILGKNWAAGNYFQGHIRELRYYDGDFSEEVVEAMSQGVFPPVFEFELMPLIYQYYQQGQ